MPSFQNENKIVVYLLKEFPIGRAFGQKGGGAWIPLGFDPSFPASLSAKKSFCMQMRLMKFLFNEVNLYICLLLYLDILKLFFFVA